MCLRPDIVEFKTSLIVGHQRTRTFESWALEDDGSFWDGNVVYINYSADNSPRLRIGRVGQQSQLLLSPGTS